MPATRLLSLSVFPSSTQESTSSRPKAAHFAAAVERSLYFVLVVVSHRRQKRVKPQTIKTRANPAESSVL
jgi:hypothetical protein